MVGDENQGDKESFTFTEEEKEFIKELRLADHDLRELVKDIIRRSLKEEKEGG